MDSRQAAIIDACAAEPTGGTPVGYLPDGATLTDDQRRAVADELAAPTVVLTDDGLRVAGASGAVDDDTAAIIGAVAFESERGDRDAGEATLQTTTGAVDVEVTGDGGVWVGRERPTVAESSVDEQRVAAALGIDVATLRDVGADLPSLRLTATSDVLAVPVNFLEHVGGAEPDPVALGEVTRAAGVDAVCAFTFDTLSADAAAHLRVFTPPTGRGGARTVGMELLASPTLAGGLVAHLFDRGIVEDATTSVEQGHFVDRPGRIHVDAGGDLRVGGHAVTTLDGTVTVPEADEDDIIEV
jgi:predicted PhzF superfamily epimerase YddE/YHI9